MKFARLPEWFPAEQQPLTFFLAMEEYFARHCTGSFFFLWQVAPTVIFGRNQVAENEVNIPFCRDRGIEIVRRRSGGGCVYADRNNLMFSHITDCPASAGVERTFAGFTHGVAAMLQRLGLSATATGRNDIEVDGSKISGYAFYHIPMAQGGSRAVVHGTMLYDVDADTMMQALTPSRVKLASNGVSSVRSRVTTVREHLPQLPLAEFKEHAIRELTDSQMILTEQDIERIREIEQGYKRPQWTFRQKFSKDARPRRIEGVGEFYLSLELTEGVPPRIADVDFAGDFFVTGDIEAAIIEPLRGAPYNAAGIDEALSRCHPATAIAGLSREDLRKLLLE